MIGAGAVIFFFVILIAAVTIAKTVKIIGQAEVMVIERLGPLPSHRAARASTC